MSRLEYERITRFAGQIIEESDLNKACDSLFDTFQDIIPFDRIGVAIIDHKNNVVRLKWVKSKNATIEPPPEYTGPVSASLKEMMIDGQPRIINDLQHYLEEHPESQSTRKIISSGMKSSLTCPLKTKKGWIGFLFFSSQNTGTYQTAHIETYQLIATQLTFLLEILELDENLNSLKIKEKFFYKCLHDMGNSLNIVSCYSKLILKGNYGNAQSKVVQAIESMDKQLDNTLNLFEELQNFGDVISADFSVHKSQVELKPFLNQFQVAAELLANKKKISTDITLDPQLPELFFMDAKRISQVLNNLLSNALKFSLPHSKIHIKVSLNSENALKVSVQDEGQGIAPSERENVFKETRLLTNIATGSEPSKGLGLAICKRIIEDHQGNIWFESTYGAGSLFCFTIPALSPETKESPILH